jgi:hypothetical protein
VVSSCLIEVACLLGLDTNLLVTAVMQSVSICGSGTPGLSLSWRSVYGSAHGSYDALSRLGCLANTKPVNHGP